MKCKDPDNHSEHICQKKVKQKFEEVKKLGKDATYFCKICDMPSSDPSKLCLPQKYEGKVGVLKWKM